jgi:hypothetical protein
MGPGLGTGSDIPKVSVYETPNGKGMVVRAYYDSQDWDRTIGVCMACNFIEDSTLSDEYIEILCGNKRECDLMRQTKCCSHWRTKTIL